MLTGIPLYRETTKLINLITKKTKTIPSKSKKLWWGHTFPILEPLNLKIGTLQQETTSLKQSELLILLKVMVNIIHW